MYFEKGISLGSQMYTLGIRSRANSGGERIWVRWGNACVSMALKQERIQKGHRSSQVHIRCRDDRGDAFRDRELHQSAGWRTAAKSVSWLQRVLQPCIAPDPEAHVSIAIRMVGLPPNEDPCVEVLMCAAIGLAMANPDLEGSLVAGARVCMQDGRFALASSGPCEKNVELDVLVIGTAERIAFVEGASSELPEDVLFDAVSFAQLAISELIVSALALAQEWRNSRAMGRTRLSGDFEGVRADESASYVEPTVASTANITQQSLSRDHQPHFAMRFSQEPWCPGSTDEFAWRFKALETRVLRNRILSGRPRRDGRLPGDVRLSNLELRVLSQSTDLSMLMHYTRKAEAAFAILEPESRECCSDYSERQMAAAVTMVLLQCAEQCVVLADSGSEELQMADAVLRVAGTQAGVLRIEMDCRFASVANEDFQHAMLGARQARCMLIRHMQEPVAPS